MNARTLRLLDFIQNGNPFEIPVYQRTYSWEIENCEKLWEDAMRVGQDRDPNRTHFVGAVIYIEEEDAAGRAKRFVIDGQQRIATATLLIEALARSLDAGGTVDGLSARELRSLYISNPNEFGDNAYRLLLNKKDRETLKAVLGKRLWPNEPSLNLQDNFDYFMSKFDGTGTIWLTESMSIEEKRHLIYNGLCKLNIVAAALNPERENPQVIFENMNTKKRSLTKSDLIRNFVLLDMDPDDQTELYKKHWRPMEEGFEQKTYAKDFDDFIRYYLAFKNRKMPVIKRLYDEFQGFAHERIQKRQGKPREAAMKEIVEDLQKFSEYFCKMKLGQEENPNLKKLFQALQELKANTLFPLLLGMYEDYAASDILSVEQFRDALGMLESFMLRRAVCGLSDGLNLGMPTYHSEILPDLYLESFRKILMSLSPTRRFPNDTEFQRALNGNIGSLNLCVYLLRRLEQYESDAQVNLDDYEVERIMPKIPKGGELSDEWKRALGPDWQEPYEWLVDNLGNLTLMKKDDIASAQEPFSVKREAYQNSGLWLNNGPKGPGQVEQWNVQAIQDRARVLAQRALEVWPMP